MALVCFFMTSGSAQSAEPLNVDDAVDDVVDAALSRPDVVLVHEVRRQALRASADEATLVPNPTLSFDYEQELRATRGFELSAMVHQQVSLSSWRKRLQSATLHREAALDAELDAWRLEVTTTVKEAFYALLYHQDREAILVAWTDRLKQSTRAIAAREQAGDASLFELRRIERALDTARAQLARERAQSAVARAALNRWLPTGDAPQLTGTMLPKPRTLPDDTVSLPALERLRHEQRALQTEHEAWGSPAFRDWEVGAGYRLLGASAVDPDALGHAILISIALPLTLRNTDLPRKAAINIEIARIEAEYRLQFTLTERARAAARERYDDILAALSALPSEEQDAELTTLAEAAYAAGEAPLLELLDAYASELDLQLVRKDLEWAARQASIELERLYGQGVTQ